MMHSPQGLPTALATPYSDRSHLADDLVLHRYIRNPDILINMPPLTGSLILTVPTPTPFPELMRAFTSTRRAQTRAQARIM